MCSGRQICVKPVLQELYGVFLEHGGKAGADDEVGLAELKLAAASFNSSLFAAETFAAQQARILQRVV
jgi:hypothetical protein